MQVITIKTRLKSDTIKLGKQVETLLGKDVEIVVRELNADQAGEKKWQHLGKADFDGKMDSVNIRDLAHD